MKRREYRAEVGTRIIERFVETLNFKGRRGVIETVREYIGEWEGEPFTYRYAVHWLFDYDTLKIKWYDKLPANDEASRYGKISIPGTLWTQMESDAYAFLATEQVRRTLSEKVILKANDDQTRVTVTFKGRNWSGFILIYGRDKNGSVRLLESRNTIPAIEERARRGHSRIPRTLCELTYDFAYRHFEGLPLEKPRQNAFTFSSEETCLITPGP